MSPTTILLVGFVLKTPFQFHINFHKVSFLLPESDSKRWSVGQSLTTLEERISGTSLPQGALDRQRSSSHMSRQQFQSSKVENNLQIRKEILNRWKNISFTSAVITADIKIGLMGLYITKCRFGFPCPQSLWGNIQHQNIKADVKLTLCLVEIWKTISTHSLSSWPRTTRTFNSLPNYFLPLHIMWPDRVLARSQCKQERVQSLVEQERSCSICKEKPKMRLQRYTCSNRTKTLPCTEFIALFSAVTVYCKASTTTKIWEERQRKERWKEQWWKKPKNERKRKRTWLRMWQTTLMSIIIIVTFYQLITCRCCSTFQVGMSKVILVFQHIQGLKDLYIHLKTQIWCQKSNLQIKLTQKTSLLTYIHARNSWYSYLKNHIFFFFYSRT